MPLPLYPCIGFQHTIPPSNCSRTHAVSRSKAGSHAIIHARRPKGRANTAHTETAAHSREHVDAPTLRCQHTTAAPSIPVSVALRQVLASRKLLAEVGPATLLLVLVSLPHGRRHRSERTLSLSSAQAREQSILQRRRCRHTQEPLCSPGSRGLLLAPNLW